MSKMMREGSVRMVGLTVPWHVGRAIRRARRNDVPFFCRKEREMQ
jgi:hypothetical protein